MSDQSKFIDVIMRQINDIADRQTRMEKAFNTGMRGGAGAAFDGNHPHMATVQKVFGQADTRSPRVLVGGDGSDNLNLVNLDGYYAGGRAKGLGMSEAWEALAAIGRPDAYHWSRSDASPQQVLQKSGFKSPQQKWGKQKVALAENSGFTGGYTVPVQFYADLLRLMSEKAFVREKCTVLPMQSRSLLVPALKQSSTTFARGQSQFFGGIVMTWTPEQTNMTESEPVFREIELVARDLMFYTVSSNQLLQDNAVALDTLLTTMFQEAVAWSYDYYILQGGAAAQEPQGVITAPGTKTISRTTASTVKLPDIANMMAGLYSQSWDNACFIASPSVIPQLVQMTNNASNAPFLTWLNPAPNSGEGGPMAQKFPAMLAGLPIYWSEKASVLGQPGDIILADLSKYLVGDRLSIQIEVSPHVGFVKNQMYWRVIVRWDGQPWQDAPVTLADGTTTVSPMVVIAA